MPDDELFNLVSEYSPGDFFYSHVQWHCPL